MISRVVKLGLLLGLILGLVCVVVGLLIGGPLVVSIARAVGWLEFSFWRFLWRGRPHPFELEAALRQVCVERYHTEIWAAPLRRLEDRKNYPGSLDSLVSALQSLNWVERFAARHTLVALASDTTIRLKKQAPHLLCTTCLVRCGSRSVRLARRTSVTYYGCRACDQSQGFLESPGKVVAVLDSTMGEGQVQQNGMLQVNWLLRRSLFDFDQVEVIRATDEDVERFTVQVRNDTDAWRRRRYKKMPCVVAPGCKLSENTLRILMTQFKGVEYRT